MDNNVRMHDAMDFLLLICALAGLLSPGSVKVAEDLRVLALP